MNKYKHIASRSALRGMSIIEIMLTIAILAVLAAVATPSFTGVLQNNRVRSQASDLMANLAIARAESTKRGVRVTLCPVPSVAAATPVCTPGAGLWAGGYIVFADVNADGAFNSGTDVLIAVSEPLSGNNTLVSTGFSNAPVNELQFRPSGTTNLPAAGGSFKLCDSRTGNFGRLISISVTGRALSAFTNCP